MSACKSRVLFARSFKCMLDVITSQFDPLKLIQYVKEVGATWREEEMGDVVRMIHPTPIPLHGLQCKHRSYKCILHANTHINKQTMKLSCQNNLHQEKEVFFKKKQNKKTLNVLNPRASQHTYSIYILIVRPCAHCKSQDVKEKRMHYHENQGFHLY